MDFLPGFRLSTIQTSGTSIRVATGGEGPPLLLLHGFPQTHIEWRKLAPSLAKKYTLVMPDLRGYGDSGKPSGDDSHINYSKRSMALDQVEVMEQLGFRQFGLVGHDRGGRVAHRLTLDHPDRVTKLFLMDICPTHYMYKTADQEMGSAYFHWFFFTQPAPLPENLIKGGVDDILKFAMGSAMPHGIESDAYAEYRRCFDDPAAIHAACEDYRAAATIDLVHDESDMNRKIACPVFILWGAETLVGRKYDVLSIWKDRATSVSGTSLPCGHWIAEERPEETAAEILRFFSS
jgi:haloacetate dehalogenase